DLLERRLLHAGAINSPANVPSSMSDLRDRLIRLMRRILLARHGETSWNAIGRLQGHTDIELNEIRRGKPRALASRRADAGITEIWSSDLTRARQTGEIVAAALGLASPAVEPELRERHYGVFEGLSREECATQHPQAWQDWVAQKGAPPGG